MKQVTIYTDGSSLGNPGPGGWGVVLEYQGREKELSGGEPATTNNRMELTAIIEGLSALKEPCEVTLYSDSQYAVKAIEQGWAKQWRQNGWKKADKKPALNADLWQRVLDLLEQHTIHLVWVKGHAGNPKNERCDVLATTYAKALQAKGMSKP